MTKPRDFHNNMTSSVNLSGKNGSHFYNTETQQLVDMRTGMIENKELAVNLDKTPKSHFVNGSQTNVYVNVPKGMA